MHDLQDALLPYLPNGSDSYRNPYQGVDWHVNVDYLTISGGIYYPFYFSAAPPWTGWTNYQSIYYHENQDPASIATFRAWKSPTEYNTYKYWTLMVVNEKGYPAAVWGR